MGLTILPPVLDSDDDSPSYKNTQPYTNGRDASPSSSSDGGMAIDDDRPRKKPRIENRDIVVPGESITQETQWMRGHGTHQPLETSTLIASTLLGGLTPTNKLLSVTPTRARYTPEIGDLVVGRIESLQQNSGSSRWKVDIAAPLLANLSMSSINLPGGALRRRNAQDELQMRNYFQEGEVLVAEVQVVNQE
ncbi:Exosome complex component RRP4, partial [Elasticomyces elasticus]